MLGFRVASMPYAQSHYPLLKIKNSLKKISQPISLPRGWIKPAVGFTHFRFWETALFGKLPYKNVIVKWTVLAEDGRI